MKGSIAIICLCFISSIQADVSGLLGSRDASSSLRRDIATSTSDDAGAQQDVTPTLPVAAQEIESRGERLRAEVEATYKNLNASHSLKSPSDLTEMVVKYIPEGISFDDAERILRAAGCAVRLPSKGFRGPTLNFRDDVVGEFELSHSFLRKTMFEVTLSPASRDDYSRVAKVVGAIWIETP
jgi:hypothetical protein